MRSARCGGCSYLEVGTENWRVRIDNFRFAVSSVIRYPFPLILSEVADPHKHLTILIHSYPLGLDKFGFNALEETGRLW